MPLRLNLNCPCLLWLRWPTGCLVAGILKFWFSTRRSSRNRKEEGVGGNGSEAGVRGRRKGKEGVRNFVPRRKCSQPKQLPSHYCEACVMKILVTLGWSVKLLQYTPSQKGLSEKVDPGCPKTERNDLISVCRELKWLMVDGCWRKTNSLFIK